MGHLSILWGGLSRYIHLITLYTNSYNTWVLLLLLRDDKKHQYPQANTQSSILSISQVPRLTWMSQVGLGTWLTIHRLTHYPQDKGRIEKLQQSFFLKIASLITYYHYGIDPFCEVRLSCNPQSANYLRMFYHLACVHQQCVTLCKQMFSCVLSPWWRKNKERKILLFIDWYEIKTCTFYWGYLVILKGQNLFSSKSDMSRFLQITIVQKWNTNM